MIILLSPAKTIQETSFGSLRPTQVRFKAETAAIVQVLAEMSPEELKKLMKISDKLVNLNYERYQSFNPGSYTRKNAELAGLAFNGAVFQGLDLGSFQPKQLAFAQAHLRILSGLYGVLRPLDLIQPYRLEMGTKLPLDAHKNLYQFWGDKITDLLNKDLKKSNSKLFVNLASKEYFKAVNQEKLDGRFLTIDFREERNGVYKFITFNAKKARGLMSRYILENQIDQPEHIKGFLEEGYCFNEDLSTTDTWVFTR